MGLKEEWESCYNELGRLKSKGPNGENKRLKTTIDAYLKENDSKKKQTYLVHICWFIKNGLRNSRKLAINALLEAKINKHNHVLTTTDEIEQFAQQILDEIETQIAGSELESAPEVNVDVDITLSPTDDPERIKIRDFFRKEISNISPFNQNIVFENYIRNLFEDSEPEVQNHMIDGLKICLEPERLCNGVKAKALTLLKKLQLRKDSDIEKIEVTAPVITAQTEQKISSGDEWNDVVNMLTTLKDKRELDYTYLRKIIYPLLQTPVAGYENAKIYLKLAWLITNGNNRTKAFGIQLWRNIFNVVTSATDEEITAVCQSALKEEQTIKKIFPGTSPSKHIDNPDESDETIDITLPPAPELEKARNLMRSFVSDYVLMRSDRVLLDTLITPTYINNEAKNLNKYIEFLKIYLGEKDIDPIVKKQALKKLKEAQQVRQSEEAKSVSVTSAVSNIKAPVARENKTETPILSTKKNKPAKQDKPFKQAPPKIKATKSEAEIAAEQEEIAKNRQERIKREAEQESKRKQRAEEEEKKRLAQLEKRKAVEEQQATTKRLLEQFQQQMDEEKEAQKRYEAEQKQLEKLAAKQKNPNETDFWEEDRSLEKNEFADVMLVNARQNAFTLAKLKPEILKSKMEKIISMIGYARAINYYKAIFKECERIGSTKNTKYSDLEKELMVQLETLKPIGFIESPENTLEFKISPEEISDNRVLENPALYPAFTDEEKTSSANQVFKFNAQVKKVLPSLGVTKKASKSSKKQSVDPKQKPIYIEIKEEVVEDFIPELAEELQVLSDNTEDVFLGGGSVATLYFKSKNPRLVVSYNDLDIRMFGCNQNQLAEKISKSPYFKGKIKDFENIINTFYPIIRFKFYDGKKWQKIEIAIYQKEKRQICEEVLLEKLYSFGDTNVSSLILNLTKKNQNNHFEIIGSVDSITSLQKGFFKIINKKGGQTVFRNDLRCILRHILKEKSFPQLINNSELKLLLDGYAINALRQAAFAQLTPSELMKPYLIQQEDGSYRIWGYVNNQWRLTDLGSSNIKLELTLDTVQTLFIENTSALLEILKKGHYFIQSKDSILSICFKELHTDRLQQKRLATFFIDTLFARYDFLTALNLLNDQHHIFVKLTDINFKYFKVLEPLLESNPNINADPDIKGLVFTVVILLSFCGELVIKHQHLDLIEREKIVWDKLVNWHFYGTLHEIVKPARQAFLRSIIETMFKEINPSKCFESLVIPIFSRYLSGDLKSLPNRSAEVLIHQTPSNYQPTIFTSTPQSQKTEQLPAVSAASKITSDTVVHCAPMNSIERF